MHAPIHLQLAATVHNEAAVSVVLQLLEALAQEQIPQLLCKR
jgi:hypothetical protein